MLGNPVVNGSTSPMPVPPPAQELQQQQQQQHYGRGRGGRPRGGYGQAFAQQQHSQQYPPQYTSPQWQQPQPFYAQHNGAQALYTAANHFNPYNTYYPQQYSAYPYYNPAYQNYIPPQQSSMYGSQAHQMPYGQQTPYVLNPQMPMVHGSHSPFPQPQAPTGQPTPSAVPNVPLTPASAHSSQLAPATSSEPGQQPVETLEEQHLQPDHSVNGNGTFESESQQPTIWSPFEMSTTLGEDTPKPNPKFSMSQVSSIAVTRPPALDNLSL